MTVEQANEILGRVQDQTFSEWFSARGFDPDVMGDTARSIALDNDPVSAVLTAIVLGWEKCAERGAETFTIPTSGPLQ